MRPKTCLQGIFRPSGILVFRIRPLCRRHRALQKGSRERGNVAPADDPASEVT